MGRRLPPLNAIRAFEAAARHLSFTRAAEELNVTQAAISHQIKGLEDVLGVPLFRRNRRGLEPTEAGRAFIEPARAVLSGLVAAVAGMAPFRPAQHRVRLHVLPILCDRWLVPRFSGFADRHPEIDVQFTTFVTQDISEPPDAVFRFGEGDWPGQVCDYLFGRDVVLEPATLEDMCGVAAVTKPSLEVIYDDV